MPGTDASEMASVDAGVTMIDTGMGGERELNAVYVIHGSEPCLVEAAPEADGEVVRGSLERLGLGATDLAHIVVTHIHMDHAGGAGALLEAFPRAKVWVHARGAPHLADPTRLITSTARTYGAAQLEMLFGGMTPCAGNRIRTVEDGDPINIGDRVLRVIATPGHASHHIALHDESTQAMYTGEAIGSYLPWANAFRPALPPPEVDVELALASIETIRARRPRLLFTSHFGPAPDASASLAHAEDSIRRWSEAVRRQLVADPSTDEHTLREQLLSTARYELAGAGVDLDEVLARYDVLGSISMNALGLGRYWRKRAEAVAQET